MLVSLENTPRIKLEGVSLCSLEEHLAVSKLNFLVKICLSLFNIYGFLLASTGGVEV